MKSRFNKGRSIAIIVFLVAVALFMAYDLNSGGCFGMEGSSRNACFYEQGKCALIQTDSSYKDICLTDAAIASQDITVCDALDDVTKKSRCQSEIAVATLDVQSCITIEDNYWADNCFYNLGGQIDSQKYYCASIGSEEQRHDCYLEFAKFTANPELCSGLGADNFDRCVIVVARENMDQSLCSYAKTTLAHDVCILRIAKLDSSLDVSVCSEISGEQIENDCEEYFASLEEGKVSETVES